MANNKDRLLVSETERVEGGVSKMVKEVDLDILSEREKEAEGIIVAAERLIVQDPDTDEAAEINRLISEVEGLRKSYLKRLGEILGHPILEYKKLKDKKIVEALAIPDNPKIIAEIKKRLIKLQGKIAKRQGVFDNKSRDEYLVLAEMYRKANKVNQKKYWSGSNHNISDLGHSLVCQSLDQGDVLAALSYYDRYDDHSVCREDSTDEEKIVKKVMDPYLQVDFKPQDEVDFELLEDKNNYLAQVNVEVAEILGARPELNKIKDRCLEDFKGKIFSVRESRVLAWPVERSNKVKGLGKELQRKFIIYGRVSGPENDDLLDEPELGKILDFYSVFDGAVAEFKPKYRSVILDKIMKEWPNTEVLKELFKKIQNNLDKKDDRSGAEQLYIVDPSVLYTLLFLANRENGEEILKKFDLKKAQALSLVQTIGAEGNTRYLGDENGDTNLVSFADHVRSHWITAEEERELSLFVEEYQASLPPRFKDGVSSWSSGGPLLGVYYNIFSWRDFVKALPVDYRHKLLDLSAANSDHPPYRWQEKVDKLDWRAVDNFLEYNQLCPAELKLGIDDLFDRQNFFEEEKWSQIKAVIKKVDPKIIDFFARKGTSSGFLGILDSYSDGANELEGFFSGSNNEYIEHRIQYNSNKYTKVERGPGSVDLVFKLVKFCQENFGAGKEMNWQFFKQDMVKDKDDQKVVEFLLDVDLGQIKDVVDIKLLEGKIVSLGYVFTNMGGEMADFKKFDNLSREEKEIYLKLMVFFRRDDVEQIMTSGKSQQVLELIQKHNLQFTAKEMLVMADHLDCVGLFYYLRTGDYAATERINKLVALHDLGLSDFYQISQADKMTKERDMYGDGDYERFWSNLMRWDENKLITLANTFAGNPTINLHRLFDINDSENFTVGQLVNRVKLFLVIQSTRVLWDSVDDEVVAEDKSEWLRQKFLEIEEILGKQIDIAQKGKFFGTKWMVTEKSWEYLKANPMVLGLFIESKKYSFIEQFLSLDQELLEDKRFWESDLEVGSEVAQNISLAKRFFVLRDKMIAAGVRVHYDFDRSIKTEEDLKPIENILFLLEKLADKKNKKDYTLYPLRKLLELSNGDKIIAENCLDLVDDIFEVASYDLEDAAKFILHLEDQQKQLLLEIRSVVKANLPFDFIKQNAKLLIDSKTAEDFLKAIEESDGIKNRSKFVKWVSARRKGAMKGIIESFPLVVEQSALKNYLNVENEYDFSGGLRLDIAQSLSNLSPRGQQNFETFFSLFLADSYSLDSVNQELIGFFESPRAEFLINWLEKREDKRYLVAQLFFNGAERLNLFLDLVDSSILEKFSELPEYLYINLLDTPVFFNDPIAEKVIDYAKKLKGLFKDQKDFKLSVYDLLLADFTEEWENLKKIENNSFFGLTNEVLKSLVIDGGELQETAQKTLAFTGESRKIEIEVMLSGLEKLSPDLRKLILFGLTNTYGVRFLANEELIKTKFNLSDDEWLTFAKEVCSQNNFRINDIVGGDSGLDFSQEVWRLLATNTKLDLNLFLKRFKGELSWAWSLFLENKVKLDTVFNDNKSGILFTEFKDLSDFWDFILKEHYTDLLKYWDNILPGFLDAQRLEKLIEQCLDSHALLMCGQLIEKFLHGKLVLTAEQIQTLAESSLGEKSEVDPMPVLLLHFDGKVTLKPEQLKSSVDLSLRRNFPLDFSRPEIKKLFEERFLEILNQRPIEIGLVVLILEKLKAVNSLNEKYFEIMREIVDEENYVGSNQNSLGGLTKLFEASISPTGDNQKLESGGELKMSKENWLPLLLTFMDIEEATVGPDIKEKIIALFKGDEAKDFCLTVVQEQWNDYLKSAEPKSIPLPLILVARQIDISGAGPLSQLEALGNFIYTFYQSLNKYGVDGGVQQRNITGALDIENRFKKGRTNPEDRSDYYHISSDIISADPSLFIEFLDVFGKLSPTQFKQFIREVYPLYRAQLILLKKDNEYTKADVDIFRENIRGFGKNFEENGSGALVEVKDLLIEGIKKTFKEKFGIIKIPDNFSEEAARTLTNFSVYLGNLRGRTSDKEAVLGFYLALALNGQWERFRRDEKINVDDYLTPEKGVPIKEMLAKRNKLSPLTAERIGVDAAELPRFKAILQNEVQNVVVGEIETVDVKLGNVLINLEGLSDPDLYPELLDKDRLQLLLEFGNKRVGAVVAKLFQEQKNPGRPIQFTAEETPVKEALEKIMENRKLPKNSETIKTYFQDGLKPFAAISNILSFAGEIGAMREVEDLRRLLVPSSKVVEIFNRFGEEFKVSSGAMAVAQDLNYLDNLIVKKSEELTAEEKTLLVGYVKQIREQLVKLEDIYEQIKNKFASFKQSASGGSNQFLKEKLAGIDSIINDQSTARVITSTMTNNFNGIIENIRECLSCRNAGCNNDTNLTFGDENKFFVYSQTREKKEGSVADQIIFVEPVVYENKTTGLAFVLDRMYGSCTPDIFINHLKTVLKKHRQLLKAFPDCQISVVIPAGVFSTGGVSVEALQSKLSVDFGEEVILGKETVSVDVTPSATGDHYVEFGGGARTAGQRAISGVVFKIKK